MSLLIIYSAMRGVLLVGLVLCHIITPNPWQLPVLLRCAATLLLTFVEGSTSMVSRMLLRQSAIYSKQRLLITVIGLHILGVIGSHILDAMVGLSWGSKQQ